MVFYLGKKFYDFVMNSWFVFNLDINIYNKIILKADSRLGCSELLSP